MKEIKLKVLGKVQGVFYRDTIRKKALLLGLSGFAKNETDGSVTVLARGGEDSLKDLLKTAEEGSKGAQVEEVLVEWHEFEEVSDEPVKFDIL